MPGEVLSLDHIRREASRDAIRRPAQDLLAKYNFMVKDGHFDIGNGRCSTEYLNPNFIVDAPFLARELAQCLIDLSVDANEADILAAPITGGALLAFMMVQLLNDIVGPAGHTKRMVPLHPNGNDYSIRPHFAKLLPGHRVWVIDDVMRTGNTLSWCGAKVSEEGGIVIATSCVFHNQRGMTVRDKSLRGVHHEYIQTFSASNILRKDCPNCNSPDPKKRKFTQI